MKRLVLAVAACAAVLGAQAEASEYFWTGAAGDNNASTAGNWKLGDGTVCTEPPVNEINSGAILVFDGTGTLSVTNTAGFKYAGYRFDNSSKVTLASKVTMGPEGVALKGSATLTISKGISFYAGTNVFDVASGSSVTYSGTAPTAASSDVTFVKRGGGSIGYNNVNINELGTLVMEGGSLGRSNGSKGFSWSTTKVIFNGGTKLVFYGAGCTFGAGWEDVPGCANHFFDKTSQGGQTLTFKGDVYYTGAFGDGGYDSNTSFTYNPGVATQTCVLDGALFDNASGKVTVSSGKMLFKNNGRITSASGVAIGKGAELEIDSTAGSFATLGYTLTDATAVLRLTDPGNVRKAKSVTVGGEAVPAGIYEAPTAGLAWLKGEGTLIVGTPDPVEPTESTSATWTGAGADTLLTNPDNWEGGELPDLASGTLVATFASGETVTVPSDTVCRLKGAVLSAPNALTMTGAELKLGSSGIVTGNGGMIYTIDCPLRLVTSQPWTVGATDTLKLGENGTVKATADNAGAITLSKSGGMLRIYSSNPSLARFSLLGEVELRADDALGGKGAVLTIASDSSANHIHTYNCKLGCSVTGPSDINGYFLHAHSGTTRFEGSVSVWGGNGVFYLCDTGAKIVFAGGVSYDNDSNWSQFSPHYLKNSVYRVHDITVENSPMVITRGIFEHGTLRLNVAGNNAPRGFHLNASETMVMGVPYALKATQTGASGVALRVSGSKIDLGGFDQAVNIFYAISSGSVVTSATEAVLHLVDNRFNTTNPGDGKANLAGTGVLANRASFRGLAGFSKEGSFTNYLMNASPTAGRLSVSNGRLVMCRAAIDENDKAEGTTVLRTEGSWRNAASLTISGAGTFVAEHGKAIGRNTEVRFVGTNGRFEVPADVTARCAALYVDGVKQRDGVWTAKTSPLISGEGSLFVGKPGLIIVVE